MYKEEKLMAMNDFKEMNLFDLLDMEQTDEPPESGEHAHAKGKNCKSSQESKTSPKKASNDGVTGKSVLKLPLTVYGRGFKVPITDLEDPTYNGLIKALVKNGYKEAASSCISFVPFDGNVAITSPKFFTQEDVLCHLEDGAVVTICTGMLQAEYSAEQFLGLNLDEISVGMLHDRWSEINPEYKIHGLCYDSETGLALPYINGDPVEKFKLPVTVNCCGENITIDSESVMMKDELNADELKEYLGFSPKTPIIFKKMGTAYLLEFITNKNAVKNIDRSAFIKKGNSTQKQAAVYYHLPLSVYFVTLGITINMESAMFDGCKKVKKEDVIDKMKESFVILRSKDRGIETFYCKETNTFSLALTSGKKGTGNAIPMAGLASVFKPIQSAKEYKACLQKDTFLGYYHRNGVGKRIEVTPVAAFIGIMGTGSECTQIKSVEFVYKLPKIPRDIYNAICLDFQQHPAKERVLQVYWNESAHEYVILFPDKEKATKTSIQYTFMPRSREMKLVLTVHSHNTMEPYFSRTDNEDELLTGFYGVIGTVDKTPTASFRVGMEGVFSPVAYSDLFQEL